MRHQIYFLLFDGIDGSKAVYKTLIEVSAKIGEAKSKKELEFFLDTTAFDCDQELGEPLSQ